MGNGLHWRRHAGQDSPGASLTLIDPPPDSPEPSDDPRPLSERTRKKLWMLLVTDVVALPWILTFGIWFDETSKLSSVATLSGHHRVVLALVIAGLVMLTGLAFWTDWFTETYRLDRGLIIVASVISILGVAGVLSVVILVVVVALLFGFVGRLLLR